MDKEILAIARGGSFDTAEAIVLLARKLVEMGAVKGEGEDHGDDGAVATAATGKKKK